MLPLRDDLDDASWRQPWDSASEQQCTAAGARRSQAGGTTKQRHHKSGSITAPAHAKQHIPAVPDGPLVISAGWGRTGTSSLKVNLHCSSPKAA